MKTHAAEGEKTVEISEQLLRQFFAALDKVHEIEQRKTWSGGYKVACSIGERLQFWQRFHQLRALIEPKPEPEVDSVHLEKINSVINDLRAAGMTKTADMIAQAINPTEGN